MPNREHEKLSDLNQREPLLGRRTSDFSEAFPGVAKLRVEVLESETMWPKEHRTWLMTQDNFRQAVDCSNPVCYGGGVDLGAIVHDMLASRETHREEGKHCRGYEGSPKGHRRYRSCVHMFVVKIEIEYATEPARSEQNRSQHQED